jgi:type IV pili sensor histidine kinase/response regulator
MPLIFVAQAQEVKSQDNPVMQDRSWNLTRRSFEPPIQPVQQKKETQEIGKQIDRYTIINKIETPAQANLLSVVISVKFAQHVITVKQAIEELLVKSGYDLDSNYESEKISNFKLPEVHREIGPIPLKRAIKVLLGPAWDLQVDEISRSIQIVQIDDLSRFKSSDIALTVFWCSPSPSNLTFQPFGKIFPSASALDQYHLKEQLKSY